MKSYKTYENSNLIKDYARLLKMTKEEVKNIVKEWEEIRLYNSSTYIENNKEYTEEVKSIANDLDSKGIFVYKSLKRGQKERDFTSWFNTNIAAPLKHRYYLTRFPGEPRTTCYVPIDFKVEIDSVTIPRINSSNLLDIWNAVHRYYKIGIEQIRKTNENYQKCIKFAIENDILVDIDSTPNEIITKVTEIASQKWLNGTYHEGESISIDCCDDCDTYYYGEHRCSCGNRRISTYVEGTIGDFYLVAEAY